MVPLKLPDRGYRRKLGTGWEKLFSFGHELIVRHPIKRCASRGRWCVYTGVCVRDLVIM